MPRFDGPFEITKAYPESSSYQILLPLSSKIFPTFHISQLRKHLPNDNTLFPKRAFAAPGPIVTADGSTEYFVEKILDKRARGRGHQYLVRWLGYRPEHDLWLPTSELVDTEALQKYEATVNGENKREESNSECKSIAILLQ